MEINHEILACYLDGTSTNEERNLVRKYLCENPLHYQELLSLIERTQLSSLTDEDFNCRNYDIQAPDTQLPDTLSTKETKDAASNCISIFRSINTSAQNCKNKPLQNCLNTTGIFGTTTQETLQTRLRNMLHELDELE